MLEEACKVCARCGASRPLADFYKHPKGKGGYFHKCKSCHREDVTTHRAKNAEHFRAYDRARYRASPTRQRQLRELFSNSELNRRRANWTLLNAIRDGRIKRAEACWHCGSTDKIEGHHVAYDMPLDVVWLCRSCHCKIHRNHKLLNG